MKSIGELLIRTAIILGFTCVIPGGPAGAFDFEQDYWLTDESNSIRHEFNQFLSWGRYSYGFNFDIIDYGEYYHEHIDIKYDTLNIGLGYRYYLNSRFNNQEIPFAFVPYNYRPDYIELAGVLSDLKYKSESDLSDDFGYGQDVTLVTADYIYHGQRYFHGLFGMYYKLTDGDIPSDESLVEKKSAGVNVGCHSNWAKFGIIGQWMEVGGNRKVGSLFDYDANGTFIRIVPYLESTPSPNLLISGAFDYAWRSDAEGYDAYRIPILCKYLTYKTWWEFAVGAEYVLKDIEPEYYSVRDVRNFQVSGNARKFLNDVSLTCAITYYRQWRDEYDQARSMMTFAAGGDVTFSRRMTFLLSLWYGVGNDNDLFDDNISRYGIATGVRGNF